MDLSEVFSSPVFKESVTSYGTLSSELVGSIVLYLCSSLSAAGGVGGGALNVPIFYFIWGFTYKESVIMSLSTLMGNYLCQVAINVPQSHPNISSRPLIYWDAVLILLPAELGGANIGVILSAIFPTSLNLILGMIVLILSFIFTKQEGMIVLILAFTFTMHKGFEIYNKETLKLLCGAETSTPLLSDYNGSGTSNYDDNNNNRGDRNLNVSGSNNNNNNNINATTGTTTTYNNINNNNNSNNSNSNNNNDTDPEEKVPFNRLERRSVKSDSFSSLSSFHTKKTEIGGVINVPYLIISVILVFWMMYAALYISLEACTLCSWRYYLLLTIIYPLLFVEIMWGLNHLIEKQKQEAIAKGDIKWADFSMVLPFLALIVGILSALLGIGGGELMGPLMLHLKVLPSVSTATTSMMSLLNTSSSLIHYVTLGEVPYRLALWGFSIGAAGGITGRLSALYVSNNYGRPSVMIFMLCGVLIISFTLYVYDISANELDFEFSSYCTA